MSKTEFKPGNMLFPVPVVLVSCQRPGEKPNLITLAWAGTINSDPPMVSISIRSERHSHDIIEETGEFVINLVNRELTFATDWCGVKSGKDFDKFKEMKLKEHKSLKVSAPGVEESPVNLECKVTEKRDLGSHTMYLAEIVAVTVDDKYLDDNGRFRMNDADLTAYVHGAYRSLGECIGTFGFSVKSNKAAKDKKKK